MCKLFNLQSMKYKYSLLILIFVAIPVTCFAQRVAKVTAEYIYHSPENTTIEQAKLTALYQAKLQAIADEFGTIVSQNNTIFVKEGNDNSNTDFQSLGETNVKGEWIETIDEPEYTIKYAENHLIVKVKVTGKIREILASQIDLIVQILCNCTDSQCERTDFMNGDDLFLRFQSPVDGFLAVYLIDANAQTAYCLLPYQTSNKSIQSIRKDTSYIFFSKEHVPKEIRSSIDEYVMTCLEGQERNDLYIIFSTNSFVKANSVTSKELIPRNLNWKDFNKWLARLRNRDKEMLVKQIQITINAKK